MVGSTDLQPALGKYSGLGKATSLGLSFFILNWGSAWSCQRDSGADWKDFQWQNWNDLRNKINNMVLNYNSKYNIQMSPYLYVKMRQMKQIFTDEFQTMCFDLSPCRKWSLYFPLPHLPPLRLSEVLLPKKPGRRGLSKAMEGDITNDKTGWQHPPSEVKWWEGHFTSYGLPFQNP